MNGVPLRARSRDRSLFCLALLSAGCYDLKKLDPGTTAVELTPNADGKVSVPELGVQGRWYAYGDRYDQPRRCVSLGRHLPESCSTVSSPDPVPSYAKPTDQGMCISGEVAKVANCLDKDQVECLAPPASGAGDSSHANVWDSGAQVVVETLTGCKCGDPGCLPDDELCYCAPVLDPVPCTPGTSDSSNIWGAGIGLDFDLRDVQDPRDALQRAAWNPEDYGITGVAFDFSLAVGRNDNAFLRVEFPILLPAGSTLPKGPAEGKKDWVGSVSITDENNIRQPGDSYPDSGSDGQTAVPSEEHPSGSPFWGAPDKWAEDIPSPVRPGHNVVHFSEVHAAPQDQIDPNSGHYLFDPTQLLGIQFHVPTRTTQADAFSFCISNLTFVRD